VGHHGEEKEEKEDEEISSQGGDIALCSLVKVDRRFRGIAVRTSEMSIYFNETTWHYIPEGCKLKFLHSPNMAN
jgi:hypothetical protein